MAYNDPHRRPHTFIQPVSRAERLGLGDAYPVESFARAFGVGARDAGDALAHNLAVSFGIRQPDVEPDEFTGAECDVDAIARVAGSAAVEDQQRPVHPADRARSDRDE